MDTETNSRVTPACEICQDTGFIANDIPCPHCPPEAVEEALSRFPAVAALTASELANERKCQRAARVGLQQTSSTTGWYSSGDGMRFFHPRRLLDIATVVRFEDARKATLILAGEGTPFRVTDYNVLDLLDAMQGLGMITPETCDRRKMLCLQEILRNLAKNKAAAEEADAFAAALQAEADGPRSVDYCEPQDADAGPDEPANKQI